MKKTILAAGFAMASAGAAASQINSAAIYAALDVATETRAAGNVVTYKKAVGGLECTRTVDQTPGQRALITESCTLDFARANPEAIYDALDVPNVEVNTTRIKVKTVKTVDNLTCTREQYVVAPDNPPPPT